MQPRYNFGRLTWFPGIAKIFEKKTKVRLVIILAPIWKTRFHEGLWEHSQHDGIIKPLWETLLEFFTGAGTPSGRKRRNRESPGCVFEKLLRPWVLNITMVRHPAAFGPASC